MCSPEVPDDPELAEWLPKFGMKPAFTPAVLAVGLTGMVLRSHGPSVVRRSKVLAKVE